MLTISVLHLSLLLAGFPTFAPSREGSLNFGSGSVAPTFAPSREGSLNFGTVPTFAPSREGSLNFGTGNVPSNKEEGRSLNADRALLAYKSLSTCNQKLGRSRVRSQTASNPKTLKSAI